jgi:hypothetical protein
MNQFREERESNMSYIKGSYGLESEIGLTSGTERKRGRSKHS